MEKSKNKKMTGKEVSVKKKMPKREYHFPGSTEFKPCSVKANGMEEATKEWKKVRKSIK